MLRGDSTGMAYAPFLVFKSQPAADSARQLANRKIDVVWSSCMARGVGLERRHGLKIYGNKSAWWNADLSKRFLQHHFSCRLDMDVLVLLLQTPSWALDSRCARLRAIHQCGTAEGPTRHTAVSQPADIAWSRPFKSFFSARGVGGRPGAADA